MTAFSFDDMLRFATEAWGPIGAATVHKWRAFNEQYFGGELRPVPLVITDTQPFGKRLGFCSYGHRGRGRTITLNVPSVGGFGDYDLLADNASLIHEMIHQFLFERGEDPHHSSAGWRREIMRLSPAIWGVEIWAGQSKTARQAGKVVRINAPHPETKACSLTQKQIARWPHDREGINDHSLGRLGS